MSKINENSIKAIYIDIVCGSRKLGNATGFIVKCKGVLYLITNWHVVSGRHFITKECLDSQCAIPDKIVMKYKDKSNIWKNYTIKLYDDLDKPKWIEHKIHNNDIDVVALSLKEISSKVNDAHLLPYDVNYELNVAEQAFILGYPFGITIGKRKNPHAIWISGTIASDSALEYEVTYNNNNRKKVPLFLIDSRTREGQSGSPVIYYSFEGKDLHYKEGQIAIWGGPFMQPIGIYSGRINKESDIGIVWKWSVLKDILEEDVYG